MFSSHIYFFHLSTGIGFSWIKIIIFFLLPIAHGEERNSHNNLDLHDIRGGMESTEPTSVSAKMSEVKGKVMDRNRGVEDESKELNQQPRTENKSKKRYKPHKESEESAPTISSSDHKMKEGASSSKGICFSRNHFESDVSKVLTPNVSLIFICPGNPIIQDSH